MTLRSRRSAVLAWLALLTGAHPARATSPDPRTLREQLEDQVLDGDRDAEDLESFRWGNQGLGAHPQRQAFLAVQAFTGLDLGRQEVGALVIFQLPLDRFTRPAVPAPSHDDANAEPPVLPAPADAFLSFPPAPPSYGLAEQTRESAPKAVPSPLVVTTEVARSCVRAAWRTAGIADDSRLDSLASRARASAALPEVRLRGVRSIDESGRLTLTEADPYHYTEAGGATNLLEARLTFRLDRVLFADDEVSLERVRIERSELRARTAAKVLQTLFEWQRAYALVQDPTLSSDDHFAAVLREIEAGAVLDVMTDGWFGKFRDGVRDPVSATATVSERH